MCFTWNQYSFCLHVCGSGWHTAWKRNLQLCLAFWAFLKDARWNSLKRIIISSHLLGLNSNRTLDFIFIFLIFLSSTLYYICCFLKLQQSIRATFCLRGGGWNCAFWEAKIQFWEEKSKNVEIKVVLSQTAAMSAAPSPKCLIELVKLL